MMNSQSDAATAPTGSASRGASAGLLVRGPVPGAPSSKGKTADDLLAHPALGDSIRIQAQALLLMHQHSPRTASPFATQQRWLISQATLAKYFRNEAAAPDSGVLSERLIDVVVSQRLASRNTASAFIKEMLKYGVVRYLAGTEGKRHRPLEPSPMTLMALQHWLGIHLTTLDALDGGQRAAALRGHRSLLGAIQPLVADGLLASNAVRKPGKTFSLFTWIDDGGIVMDRLIAGCLHGVDGTGRIATDVESVSTLAQRLCLSRTQLSRKFAEAEAMGSLGWSGTRGKSAIWVSNEFWREYHIAQAVKLAIIDAAFATCFESVPRLAIDDAWSA
jgi:AraC-like DNA-binding protein